MNVREKMTIRNAYFIFIKKIILHFLVFAFFSGCGIQINDGTIIPVTSSATNESTPTISADQIDDDNTSTGFGGANHNGTSYSSNLLTLNTTTNNSELDESWTPKWSNLVAYWKFNNSWTEEISGNDFIDSNGATFTTDNKLGGHSAIFDGVNDLAITTNDLPSMTSITISVWAKRNGSGNNYGRITNWDGSSERLDIGDFSNSGEIGIKTPSLGTWQDTNIDFSSNWDHIAVTATGTTLKLFVNGVLRVTYTSSVSTSGKLQIGTENFNTADFNGQLDDLAIWDTALSDEEVSLIYQRQLATFAGEMKSRVMNSENVNSAWTNINWTTTIPFLKELPGQANSESSSNYSQLIGSTGSTSDDDLMSGLIALWHFNESSYNGTGNEVVDSSGNNYHGTRAADANTTEHGLFNRAAIFDGSGDNISFGDNITDNLSALTVSFWVKTLEHNNAVTNHIIRKYANSGNWNIQFYKNSLDRFCLGLKANSEVFLCSTSGYYTTDWTHVAGTYDGSNMRIYVNGIEAATTQSNSGTLFDNWTSLYIGSSLNGYLDELAFWNRALSSEEVLQLYRRGSNQIKIQVRSCSASDCSDQDALTGDGWKGPGGNYLTYISELYNNSSVTATCGSAQECYKNELTLVGDIELTSPNISLNDFSTDGLLGVDNNQYFQYRLILESHDNNTACNSGTSTCMPELKSVTIGPDHEI